MERLRALSAESLESQDNISLGSQNRFPTKLIIIAIVAFFLIVGAVVVFFLLTRNTAENVEDDQQEEVQEKVQLVYLVHWTWEEQLDGLQRYLDEYTALHPEIAFTVKTVAYGEYPEKLELFHDTDAVPDIYQVYSSWGVSLAENGVLAAPPDDIIADVEANYLSTAGVTVEDQIWGIPSEINDYCLVYDRELFEEAGLVDAEGNILPIETWDQLIDRARLLTQTDENGVITQYGIAFGQGEDWGVVDPFLSLLWSNDGSFLAEDYSSALIDSPEGVEALQQLDILFAEGITDLNGNIFDFGKGDVAMVISPPWLESTFKENFGERYEDDIGVIPLPKLKKQTSLQYSWFVGVMEKSAYKEEAWEFLRWFTSDVQPETNTTRYGDLLADVIGAIPARKIDADNHRTLEGVFKKTFVDQLENSTPEPNVLDSARIKNILTDEISAVWVDEKTPREALSDAKTRIDAILKLYYTEE